MKKIIVLTGFLFCFFGVVMADEFKVDNLYYEVVSPENKTVRVVFHPLRPYDNLTQVEIPSKIKHEGKKYTVVEIGDNTFNRCDVLREVILPETLKKIGFKGFNKCPNLQKIVLPASLEELGGFAFEKCLSLQTIEIPQKVKKVGEFAFSFCSDLETITLPASCVELADGSFWECRALTTINLFAVEPPAIALPSKQNNGSFLKQTASHCTVIVPKGSKTKYVESNWGKLFEAEKIVERQ